MVRILVRTQVSESNVDFENSRKVLEVVLAARERLTFELLLALTSLDAYYRLPDAIAAVSPLIVEVRQCYSLFHKSLAD